MKFFFRVLSVGVLMTALDLPVHAGGKSNVSVGVSFGVPGCYPRPCRSYGYGHCGYGYPCYPYRPYYPVYVAPQPVYVQQAPIVQPIVQPVVVQQPVIQAPMPAVVPPVVARASNIDTGVNESALVARLSDQDDKVRQDAVMQLGRSKSQSAIDQLAATLAGDRSPAVRDAAARALGLIGSPKALTVLEHAAQADADRDVRHSAQFAVEVIRSR